MDMVHLKHILQGSPVVRPIPLQRGDAALPCVSGYTMISPETAMIPVPGVFPVYVIPARSGPGNPGIPENPPFFPLFSKLPVLFDDIAKSDAK